MRAWLEVDLGVIAHNYDTIKSHLGAAGIIAVVKSDAYGHGIEAISKLLEKKGVLAFAVISLEEAIRVRKVASSPILIMGYLDDQEIEQAIACGFVISVFDIELAPLVESIAARQGRRAIVHLKIETGLNRLGLQPDEAEYLLTNQHLFPHLRIESVYSHLSTSSQRDENLVQLENFENLLKKTFTNGDRLPLHLANSHSLPNFREGFLNAVRLGLALYGVDDVIPNLRPSLSCRTVVIQRKWVKAGEGISYNKLFRAPKDMEVGVIGIGYAEGLTQALTGKANVLVDGKLRPILGQICMNLCVIDLTDIPGGRGTEVTVVGRQLDSEGRENQIRVVDLALAAGIRHHEILTRFGLALPKIYVNDPYSSAEGAIRSLEISAPSLIATGKA